jgi:hypothetical protein
MTLRKALLLFGLLATGTVLAQIPAANTPQLSEQATISVVTLGPWQAEVYSAFGHSAFRVYDPVLNADAFFNYGAFNFNQPNFYLNFARGHLNYKLDVDQYPPWRDYYISNNRYVHEQVLNLTQSQKQRVFDYLYWNSLPGNEYYFYDYFYDNCATRIRDVIKTTLKDEVDFDSTYITTDYTIRQLTDLYLKQQPWGDLGIDICLGLPMDKKASPFEYMFLPDYIESAFEHATIKSDSIVAPLVLTNIPVYESKPEEPKRSLFHPWLVFGAFLLITIGITFRDWKKQKTSKWFDLIVFSIVGLVGLLLFFLWVATDHKAAARNLNILWAMPLHLVFLPFYLRGLSLGTHWFRLVMFLNLFLLISWAWLPQQLNVFLIPFVLALTVRAAWIGYQQKF